MKETEVTPVGGSTAGGLSLRWRDMVLCSRLVGGVQRRRCHHVSYPDLGPLREGEEGWRGRSWTARPLHEAPGGQGGEDGE